MGAGTRVSDIGDPEEAFERAQALRKEIMQHDHRYYVLAAPVINDREYDRLFKELQDLEERFPELADPNSPTQRVGGDITKNFPTVPHRWPMLSLGNSYSREEAICDGMPFSLAP